VGNPRDAVKRARVSRSTWLQSTLQRTQVMQFTRTSIVRVNSGEQSWAVLATWVICSQNRHLQHDLTSPLLAEKREMSVQSTKFALPHALTTHQFSRRRSSSSVSCLHLHQIPGMFLLSHPPRWLLALDKTAEYFLAARSAGRSCQREIRTCR
jgi:hypothetical protein